MYTLVYYLVEQVINGVEKNIRVFSEYGSLRFLRSYDSKELTSVVVCTAAVLPWIGVNSRFLDTF